MKIFTCLLTACALLPLPPVCAGDLTLFGGFHHPGKITVGSAARGSFNFLTDPKDFAVVGGRLSHGRSTLGLEHTIAFSPNFLESRARATIYNSNLIAHAPLLLARPYATAGIGLVRASGDGPAAFGNKFAINYGGGVKLTIFGPVGGRIDVRGYSVPKVQGQTLSVLEVSAGVVFSY